MSETFIFDVNYSTSFEDLERLRAKMLEFVKLERRDFQPVFDVTVKGMLTPYIPFEVSLKCDRFPGANKDDALCRYQVQE
jgi:hypothetical protein